MSGGARRRRAWVVGAVALAAGCADQPPMSPLMRGFGGPPAGPAAMAPSAPYRPPVPAEIAGEIARREYPVREAAIQRVAGAPPPLVEQRIAAISLDIGAALQDRYPQELIRPAVMAAVDDATQGAQTQQAGASIARQRAFHDQYLGRPAGLDQAFDAEAEAIDRIARLRNQGATDTDPQLVEVAQRVMARVPGASEPRVRLDLINRVNRRQGELIRATEGNGGTLASRAAARADGPLRMLGGRLPSPAEATHALDEARAGRPDQAVAIYRNLFERQEAAMALMPSQAYGHAREAQAIERGTAGLLDAIATIAEMNPHHPGAVRLAYEATLASRFRSLEAERRLSAALGDVADPSTRQARQQLSDVRARVAAIELQRAAGARLSGDEERERATLAQQEQQLYETLARAAHIERSKDRTFAAGPAVEALQGGLGEREVLLSYVEYRQAGPEHAQDRYWWPRRYGAFVLSRTGLTWAPLGDANDIDRQVEAYLRLLAEAGAPLAAKQGEAARLADRLLGPIGGSLGGVRAIRIFCDGTLALLPFAALGDGTGWLADRYELTYGITERLRLGEHAPRAGTRDALVVVGGPYGGAAKPFTPGDRLRPAHFPPLAGLATEGERIRALLPRARLIRAGETNEATMLAPGAPPLVMHIAAHGVFLPLAPASAGSQRGLVLTSTAATGAGGNAGVSANAGADHGDTGLIRSALVVGGLAGGPAADGFLTAYEVAAADLWGTELVVLSACESGRGTPDRARGVQGLRAAFFTAGARALVTSLWSVDDQATRELMEIFYGALRDGAGRADALARASASVRARHPDPFFWAPFILLGDTGALSWNQTAPVPVAGEDAQSRRQRAMAARRREHTTDALGSSLWTAFGDRDAALDDFVQRPTQSGGSLNLNLIGGTSALAFTVASYAGPRVYRIGETVTAGARHVADPVSLKITDLGPARMETRAVAGSVTVEQDDDATGVAGVFDLRFDNGTTASGRFAVPSADAILPLWIRQRAGIRP